MLNPLQKTGIFCYMKAIELEKAYDPKTFEERIYRLWKEIVDDRGIESLKVIPIGGSNG